MDRAYITNNDKINAYRLLVEKPKEEEPPERSTRTWGIILRWVLKRDRMG
jgi:hypothetical protein